MARLINEIRANRDNSDWEVKRLAVKESSSIERPRLHPVYDWHTSTFTPEPFRVGEVGGRKC